MARRGGAPPIAFFVLPPALAIVATLLALEALLALFHPVPFSTERNMYFVADPYTGYRLMPNSHGAWGPGVPADVNANGHRDVPTTVAKPDGVFRILALGDSFTVGADVLAEQAYPKMLERLLAARTGRRVQAINAGVGGWDPFMYAQYYEHYGRAFRPDLVLVGFFVGNDAYSPITRVEDTPTALAGRRVSRAAAELGPLAAAAVWLTEHSHLVRLLLQRSPEPIEVTRERCDRFPDEYLAIQRERLANHTTPDATRLALADDALRQIARIEALADADGIPLLVAFLPDENQVNPALRRALLSADEERTYDFTMPQALLTRTFAAAGVATLDLLPAFLADPRCLYVNTSHWTPEGHALAAAVLAERLAPAIR